MKTETPILVLSAVVVTWAVTTVFLGWRGYDQPGVLALWVLVVVFAAIGIAAVCWWVD